MKAITLWQPWASLLACGAKKYETRSWATSYRGSIAIHAAKRDVYKLLRALPHDVIVAMFGALGNAYGIEGGIQRRLADTQGCIIATAELVGCQRIFSNSGDIACFGGTALAVHGDELLFGDWTPGRYAWELANVEMLPEPIPAKGKQGLWNWEATP